MTTTSGIQERLHKRADDELKMTVAAIIFKCATTLNQIIPGSWATHVSISLKVKGEVVISPSAEVLLNNIEAAIIDRLTDTYRENTVKEFMEKVDTLHEQIDELRDEIQEG